MNFKKGLAVMLAIAALAVPAITMAGLGDERPTTPYVQGMPGLDHVVFNSLTGVPNIGDERNFFHGKVATATTDFTDPVNTVKSGDELLVRVYVHNNADAGKNADGSGIARNTRVRVTLPTGLSQNQTASAFISADNAQPQTVEDTFSLTAPAPVSLAYVPGSAAIKTNYQNAALSDEIVKGGVLIGDDNLAGNVRGYFQNVALVTFKVKITAPSYKLETNVRLNGTANFADQVSAKAGDKVDINLGFQNTGTTGLDNVVLGNRLPVGLTYVPGTTEWISHQTNQQWAKISNDDWMKGGLDVGSFLPGAIVMMRFTAQIDDAIKFQCGMNQIVNHGFAKPKDQTTIQDSATISVTKECAAATPIYSCGLLDVAKGDNRTVTVRGFEQVAKDGAVFKHVVLQWGDGSETLTNTAVGQTHSYAADGNYTVRAVVHFDVNGQNVIAGESSNCAKTISFTAPPAPATPAAAEIDEELPAAGSGQVLAVFAAATVVGVIVHRLFLSRRILR